MKIQGSKNRGSHPDGLPLARSGLYISCAYLLLMSCISVARSRYIPVIGAQKIRRERMAECEKLAVALIELHKPETADLPERGLMVAYFEQWLNGLVYELFFPAELHARNLHLFDETAKLLPAHGPLPASSLHAAAHPLRIALDTVRIIEGKA